MLFFVKVRIDVDKLLEFGQKLQNGELDTRSMQDTYCLEADPAVGLTVWEADDQADFEAKFAPLEAYYAEVLEITPVIPARQAQQVLMKRLLS